MAFRQSDEWTMRGYKSQRTLMRVRCGRDGLLQTRRYFLTRVTTPPPFDELRARRIRPAGRRGGQAAAFLAANSLAAF